MIGKGIKKLDKVMIRIKFEKNEMRMVEESERRKR